MTLQTYFSCFFHKAGARFSAFLLPGVGLFKAIPNKTQPTGTWCFQSVLTSHLIPAPNPGLSAAWRWSFRTLVMGGIALMSQVQAASVNLAWDASASTDVSGYRIYFGTSSNSMTNTLAVGNTTTTTVSSLTSGTNYFFTAKATNAAGLESAGSNVLSYTPPNPPPPTNTAPVMSLPADQTVATGQTVGPIGFSATDAQTALSGLTFSAISSNQTLVPNGSISFGVSGTSPTITVVPAAGQSGSATVSGTVSDGTLSATDSFVITVNAVGGSGTATGAWPATTVPGVIDAGADRSVELGVKIRSDVSGFITGIRFYKASTNTGTHIGSLWSGTGTKLASATFTAETSSGWQQVTFATPVPITANTVYVASYHCNTGHYSADESFFATAGVDNPPIHALKSGVSGGNGVHVYGSTPAFPTLTWNNSNYWVDVVFKSGTTGTPLSVTTASLANGTVNVTYSATLAANGGVSPYAWSMASGTLPAGLVLNAATGTITGNPTTAGTSSFTVMVRDASNPAQSLTKPLTIVIGATPTALSIWPATAVPKLIDGGADSSVELGVKFRSDAAGYITGIRFYKASTNTGTHTGSLWNSTGTRLASATFSGETGSGWQQVKFATPVPISANTVYVASYHANTGHYSADVNFFATTGVDTPPLHALKNGVSGGNGVYSYGTNSVFPTQTWNTANYWVDVLYQSGL